MRNTFIFNLWSRLMLLIIFLVTYSTGVLTLLCNLVLIKSNGWNRIVEKVPENEPARKDFNMGYCKNIFFILFFSFSDHKPVNVQTLISIAKLINQVHCVI